jgi:carboxymethylenebutenolidase
METIFETLEVQAPAGSMPTWVCRPREGGCRAAVIVLMEAFGLNEHVRDLLQRLGAARYVALAPDLYYREADDVRPIPYSEPDRAADMVMRTVALSEAREERIKDDRMLADVDAVLAALPDVEPVERIGLLGLSTGARLAFLLACREPDAFAAVVAFYGGRIVPVVEESRTLRAPLLMLFGEKDPGIPMPQVDRIRAELEHRGSVHEIETFAGAGHGFLSRGRETYHEPSAKRAWQRAMGWLEAYL